MAYEALTPTRFKALKPQFAAVLDATVQTYIDLAGRFVDQSWSAGDFETAWAAMTCHLMTLDGLGTDPQSLAFAEGTAEFQTIKSADLTLTRYQKSEAAQGTFTGWLGQTQCGQFYALLLKMNRGGPRVAIASAGCGPSGYAKDWPLGTGGWPSWWWSGA